MSGEIREKLRQALSKIDRPGSFCVSGSAPSVLPGLDVQGFGPVGLPLTVSQAEELIKRCDQAPYGKGEKTLVDTKVRHVWRMVPDRFALTNPEWDRFITATVAKVQEELGLEQQKLTCHLYDLLVYEPGSFFLPHRDGERLARMVATLVVALPSTYEGGELVVRHEGHEEIIDFRSPDANPFHTHFAAFYADCEHEVRPVREGYRLCLVYNLTLAKATKPILAPRETEHVATVSRLLDGWAKDDSSGKLVITLDHQYTESGLTWDALKGVDRARAKILREAAGQANCKAYLGLVTLHESGAADYVGSRRGYGRGWGRYGEYGSGEAEDYEMGEIYETSLTAAPSKNRDDTALPIPELNISKDELLDPEALRAVEPEEEFEGYTGNAGMTLDHWYRHAAILVWPARKHFEILCNRDGRNAVPELVRMVAQWRNAAPAARASLHAQCIELGKAILSTWQEQRFGRMRSGEAKEPELLEALGSLGDLALIDGFFRDLLTKDVTLDPGKSVAQLCEKYGWSTFQDALQAVMEATSNETMERHVGLLEQICSARGRKKAGWSELCATLALAIVTAVERADRTLSAHDWRARGVDRTAVLAGLTRSLILADQSKLLSRILAHVLATPKIYPLTPTLVDALTSLHPWITANVKTSCAPLATWLCACREQLEALTTREPEPPKDQQREANIDCKCGDCTELKKFLVDPLASTYRFSVRQDRRNHLEQTIRARTCDVDVRTERRGSPHTLVCTKNTASFQARLKKYHEDTKHLATIRTVERSIAK